MRFLTFLAIALFVAQLATSRLTYRKKNHRCVSVQDFENLEAQIERLVEQQKQLSELIEKTTVTTTTYNYRRYHGHRSYPTDRTYPVEPSVDPMGSEVPATVEIPKVKLSPNLKGFWPLNKAYGLQDLGPLKKHGKIFSNRSIEFAKGITGEKDGAVHFPGKSDYYVQFMNDDDKLNIGKSLTFSVFIGAIKGDGPILDFSSPGCNWAFHVWVADNFNLFVRIRDRNRVSWEKALKYQLPAALRDNWTWMAFSLDTGSMKQKLWINGTLQTGADAQNVTKTDMIDTKSNPRMGSRDCDSRYLKASVTCLMIFDKALTHGDLETDAREVCRQSRHNPIPGFDFMDFEFPSIDLTIE